MLASAVARADGPPAPPPEAALAGFHNGLFYLRDRSDAFRLYVQGRVNVDGYQWLGPGVSQLPPNAALKTTFFLRRARLEMAGEFFHHWQWQISGEFAPTSVDNPAAQTDSLSCKVNAAGAQTCTPQTNPVEAAAVRPIPTDAFVNYGPSPYFNVQIGQYLVPFTLEARISDNVTPFLERNLIVRNIGAPTTRDIGAMVWGESPNRLVYYTLGVYDGDGQNKLNADSRLDTIGRAFVRPFATAVGSGLPEDAQLGVSGRVGSRDKQYVGYDVNPLTTQGGYAFWKPTYTDSNGRLLHVIPRGYQWAAAADLYVPVDGFDLTAEFTYASSDTREAADGYQLSGFDERYGSLRGWGYYAQVGYWVLGDRSIVGFPSYGRPLHADFTKPEREPRHGLEVLAKWEQLHLTYEGASHAGTSDARTPNGDIDVQALSLGVNYWATRHVRVTANYSAYLFPDSAPVTASANGGSAQTSSQRALAPAQNLPVGVNDAARDGGHALHELGVRVGVQF